MTPLSDYIPHRELAPARRCTGCRSYLSTGNLTATCWQCEPTWSDEIASLFEQAEAFARLMDSGAPA